jgi:hypothetical protein
VVCGKCPIDSLCSFFDVEEAHMTTDDGNADAPGEPPSGENPPPWLDAPPGADAKPRTRRRALVIIAIAAGVLALCCVGVIVTAVLLLNRDGSGGVGDTVRDGRFEFVVKQVQCGQHKVGDDVLGKTADGQFCFVTLTVRNVGTEAWAFSDIDQKGFTAEGREFQSDFEAGIYANRNNDVDSVLGPGKEIQTVVVFEIPASAQLAKVELHESAFSHGVIVNVT